MTHPQPSEVEIIEDAGDSSSSYYTWPLYQDLACCETFKPTISKFKSQIWPKNLTLTIIWLACGKIKPKLSIMQVICHPGLKPQVPIKDYLTLSSLRSPILDLKRIFS